MTNAMKKYLQEREELNRQYNSPEYKRLKWAALAFISITIILLAVMALCLEHISPVAMLIMRGCAGVCALMFVVLVGILSYKANKQHITNRWNK